MQKGKKGKKDAKKTKISTAKKGKKGNDRLVPRDNVPNIDVKKLRNKNNRENYLQKNPFLYRNQPEPEYVSVASYYRRLIRAAVRKNSKEMANFFKSGKKLFFYRRKRYKLQIFSMPLENLEYEYSCRCPLTALRAVLATKDIPFIAEYFKNISKVDNTKKRFREPNLLQKV